MDLNMAHIAYTERWEGMECWESYLKVFSINVVLHFCEHFLLLALKERAINIEQERVGERKTERQKETDRW